MPKFGQPVHPPGRGEPRKPAPRTRKGDKTRTAGDSLSYIAPGTPDLDLLVTHQSCSPKLCHSLIKPETMGAILSLSNCQAKSGAEGESRNSFFFREEGDNVQAKLRY